MPLRAGQALQNALITTVKKPPHYLNLYLVFLTAECEKPIKKTWVLFSTSFLSEWRFPLPLQQPNSAEAAETPATLLQSLCSYGD